MVYNLQETTNLNNGNGNHQLEIIKVPNGSSNTPNPIISPFSDSRKATYNLNNKAKYLN